MDSTVSLSMASSTRGKVPEEMIAPTQAMAASMEGKAARSVRMPGGTGVRSTSIFVTVPRVPSEPTRRLRSSGPASSREKRSREPSGITASSARTWFVVTPYLRQRGPPAFSPTLPPSVQTR